ncbi:MAG TPA: glycosyltransferase family 1 protein [Acidimicrobiales bacterium]|nr:glycosyltransferase family 1 protein [Acidimicrobiales bacterium]
MFGPLLVCPSGHGPPAWSGPVRQAPIPPGRPGRLLWEQLAVPALAAGRPVISLANTAPLTACDIVCTYDAAFLAHPEWFRPSFRHSYGRVTAAAARRAASVVVPSRFTADELHRLLAVPPHRVNVVPPGIDSMFVPPTETLKVRVRTVYELPERFVLFVGSRDPRKGLEIAARAAASAGLMLVVAGASVAAFSGRSQVRGGAPGVVYLDRVPDSDLVALYGAALALLYPSRYEGFGLPPLEAMACGTPVVASDIPAVRETSAGAAVLCPPDDPVAWETAVGAVTSDAALRSDLVEAGAERAARSSWAEAGEGLAAVIRAWPRSPG